MSYQTSFFDAVKLRRSTITLSKKSNVSDERILSVVEHAIKHAPSPFSIQSARAIVLFGKDHEKLWDFGMEAARKQMPPAVFETYVAKIQGHRDSYGTVLFFEDTDAVKGLPPPLQAIIGKYPEWYEHSNGMTQFIAWTALCVEGLGCNLQHFQPGISEDVAKTWNVPESWSLRAQLVFGIATGPPRGGDDKVFAPVEPRIKIFGLDK